jgi:hypothetical protein
MVSFLYKTISAIFSRRVSRKICIKATCERTSKRIQTQVQSLADLHDIIRSLFNLLPSDRFLLDEAVSQRNLTADDLRIAAKDGSSILRVVVRLQLDHQSFEGRIVGEESCYQPSPEAALVVKQDGRKQIKSMGTIHAAVATFWRMLERGLHTITRLSLKRATHRSTEIQANEIDLERALAVVKESQLAGERILEVRWLP